MEVPEKAVYEQAPAILRTIFSTARLGQAFATDGIRKLASELLEDLLRNPLHVLLVSRTFDTTDYTFRHSISVAALSIVLAHHLGHDKAQTREIALAALLHDIGKAKIPDSILNKPGPLDDREWERVREHPIEGYRILREQPDLPPLAALVALQHHERLDGSGYPGGLRTPDIVTAAQIVAVADVYDALTSDRPYRRRFPPPDALRLVLRQAGAKLHPQACACLVHRVGVFPPGTWLRLGTGEFAVVKALRTDAPSRPIVQIVLDRHGRPFHRPHLLNLLHHPSLAVADVLAPHEVAALKLLYARPPAGR